MGKEQENNGFSIALRPMKDSVPDLASRFLLGLVLFGAMCRIFLTITGVSTDSFYWLPLLLIGTVFCLVSSKLPDKWQFAQYAAVLILAVYTVLASRWIVDGWNVILNQVCAGLELHIGRIFPRYAVEAETVIHQLCSTLFLVIPAALLGLFAGWSAGGRVAVLVLIDVLVLALALTGLYTPDIWLVFMILLTAIVFARSVTSHNTLPDRGRMIPWMVLVLVVLSLFAWCSAFFVDTDSAVDAAEARRLSVERDIYRMRYESEKQILPRGDFSVLGDFEPDEEKVLLRVEMSEPVSIYLRGFVGERYVADGWAQLPAVRKATFSTDFSWLHNRSFYGQNQIAELADILNLETKLIGVSVDNISAGSGYRYAPYELKTGDPSAVQIGDAVMAAEGLYGERQYQYYMTDYSVNGYEGLYNALSNAWNAGNAAAALYLENENVYREYANANYLDVPKDAQKAIDGLLEGQVIPENVSFQYAKQAVQACLSAALAYNETPIAYQGGDFLDFLFNESHEGYSVHYATAATMLFRSFGIPARYVEGYFISAEDAAVAEANGGVVELTEADAHAWVEIYRNGVGFVPFEAMPSGAAQEQQQNPNNAGGAAQEPEPQDAPIPLLLLVLYVLLALLSLLLLILAVLALRRHIIRSRWTRRLAGCSNEQAVDIWVAYAVKLFGYMDVSYENGSLYALHGRIAEMLGAEYAVEFSAVVAIQQQARFSAHPVQEEQYARVCSLVDSLVLRLQKDSKLWRRFCLRYLDCII